TTRLPSLKRPFVSAYRNSERASRCLRLPVTCVDSSLRYNWMLGQAGSRTGSRGVSDDRQKSALILCIAHAIQARSAARGARPPAPLARREKNTTEAARIWGQFEELPKSVRTTRH